MKYLKKIIWVMLAIFFVAAVIIGIGIIFAVKNVNISLENYRYGAWEEISSEERESAAADISSFKNLVLEKYRGTLIGYITEEEIAECFKGTDYVLSGLEKEFPCTLNITLHERREVFTLVANDKYEVYDENGEFLYVKDSVQNNIDGASNILVIGAGANQIKEISEMGKLFCGYFEMLRAPVEKIEVETIDSPNMVFCLRCGIKIRLVDYKDSPSEKLGAAYQRYSSLTGEEKLKGTIYAVKKIDDGNIVAEYTV